jgi:hypothetical protein
MKQEKAIQNVVKTLTIMIVLSGCKISEKGLDSSEIQSTDTVDGARNCLENDDNHAVKGFFIQQDGNVIPYCGLKNWEKLGIDVHAAKEANSGLSDTFKGGVIDEDKGISCDAKMILVSATITNNKLEGKCASLKGTTYGVKSEFSSSLIAQENILDGKKLKKIECPVNQYVSGVTRRYKTNDIAITCASIIKSEF